MKSSARARLVRIRRQATRRAGAVVTHAMGKDRLFRAYDLGADTFVFEQGVLASADEHTSVLIVAKGDLVRGARGYLMTVTTGNHSVAAIPLLGGRFWNLAKVKPARLSQTMRESVLCANVVDGKLELSQRDVSCAMLAGCDRWLVETLGFSLSDVVLIERNPEVLAHYRRLGQEWRIKPLAWTAHEMSVALAASRKRISTRLSYYHNVKGVHFLSYADFHRFAAMADAAPGEFVECLHELVSVFEGQNTSFLRQPKYRGHHEIELFGLRLGTGEERIVPELERLSADLAGHRIAHRDLLRRMARIDRLYRSLLTRPTLADDSSRDFTETMYMNLTGEVYALDGDGATPAFDDRRVALPGATFVNGRPVFHCGADARSVALFANVRAWAGKGETLEWANVYELRTDCEPGEAFSCAAGAGDTREIVYKTARSPLAKAFVEKRLARAGAGYGGYVMARCEAFKALGADLAEYRLIRRVGPLKAASEFYLRTRCEGVPLGDIPAGIFRRTEGSGEDPRVLKALAFLMGDAAAQNLVMKKYDSAASSAIYGAGKEIYRFDHDIEAGRIMPYAVSCCSVRGTFGWPDTSCTERNLRAFERFYINAYADVFEDFVLRHQVISPEEHAAAFLDGFAHRTRAMAWRYSVRSDEFDAFDPPLPACFRFRERWRFALWALEMQSSRLDDFGKRFLARMRTM